MNMEMPFEKGGIEGGPFLFAMGIDIIQSKHTRMVLCN